MQSAMSGEVSDTYAVVDKSKKSNRSNDSSQLHQDSITDVYAVVEKKRKINHETTNMGNYDLITADTINSTAADDIDLYDYASAPVYGELDNGREIQNESAKVIDTEKVCGPIKHSKTKKCQGYSVLMVTCFIILISAVIIATVAVVIAFSLIAGLRSELNSVMKKNELSQNNFKQKLSLLQMDIHGFIENTISSVASMNKSTSKNIQNLSKEINLTQNEVLNLEENVSLIEMNLKALESNFSKRLNVTANDYYARVEGIKYEINENIANASETSLITIKNFSHKLASEIQKHHTFNSCEDVSNFSIELPSGMYNIRARNSSDEYCSTTIAFSCHGIRGRWRRIAYLSNDTSTVECPMGFELINDSNVPALCRRNPTGARCSSITYLTHGNSYSQVCGTIHGSYFGDPDGFGLDGIRYANTPIHGNYVDGISLTHGSMNEQHIWTFSATVNFVNPNDICSVCASNKPSYVGMDYSCDVLGTRACKSGCSPRQIWGSGQCIGNNTFYKNLMQPTSDDIEMRVCTDQTAGNPKDEDIFLSYVELYIM